MLKSTISTEISKKTCQKLLKMFFNYFKYSGLLIQMLQVSGTRKSYREQLGITRYQVNILESTGKPELSVFPME